jgi:hypothetical protein
LIFDKETARMRFAQQNELWKCLMRN